MLAPFYLLPCVLGLEECAGTLFHLSPVCWHPVSPAPRCAGTLVHLPPPVCWHHGSPAPPCAGTLVQPAPRVLAPWFTSSLYCAALQSTGAHSAQRAVPSFTVSLCDRGCFIEHICAEHTRSSLYLSCLSPSLAY